MCGACSFPSGPGTRPGRMVRKCQFAADTGGRSAKTDEMRVEGNLVSRIGEARIAPGGVRLPDLEHRIGYADALTIEHAPAQIDRFALGHAAWRGEIERVVIFGEQIRSCPYVGLADEVSATFPRQAVVKEGTDGLGRRLTEEIGRLIVEAGVSGCASPVRRSCHRSSKGVARAPLRTMSKI